MLYKAQQKFKAMNLLRQIFGEGEHLNTLQISSRSIVMFAITLVLIRIAGAKTFGKNSAFDNVIVIMLGAVLSRGVVGASSFWGVVAGGLAMVLMTRLISWIAIHNKQFSRLVKGEHISLYEKGVINHKNLHKNLLSENDMMEAIRQEANANSLQEVKSVFLECNGQLSVIKNEK